MWDKIDSIIPPDTEIWYKSTDGEIVTPEGVSNIVSNTYKDGWGKIKCSSKITSIGNGFMQAKTNLLEIYMPDTLKTFGFFAFRQASAVKKIRVGRDFRYGDTYFLESSGVKELIIHSENNVEFKNRCFIYVNIDNMFISAPTYTVSGQWFSQATIHNTWVPGDLLTVYSDSRFNARDITKYKLSI